MSELDEKLNSILSNPAMMQQIMSLAQSLNQSNQANQSNQTNQANQASGPQNQNSPAPPRQARESAPIEPGINPNLLSKLAGIMQRGSIDKNQESLLKALRPYLSNAKLQKLERAMHAAKMAGVASEMVTSRGQSPFSGR